MKTLKIGAGILGVAFALAASGSSASAQLVNGVWRLPPQSGAARGVARNPEPIVIVTAPTVFHRQFHHRSVFPRHPIVVTSIPAVLLSDGTVLADFGFGLEPVFRSCRGAVVVGQPRVIASNGVVLSSSATYTQPVPNQQTSSQQMVAAQTRRTVISSGARSACFGRDGAGRVIVFP